ncbi:MULTISPECIES: ScbR family autoregulator-binding transcription factor [Streptomyces]|uniref:TetR/AcrR family transcriptional regulator n=1 Tax=Streptomyces apricus TaxID=1828112 RepID=A0A5A9Z5C1_9ACTN|nr:ScbR family autoregulator-binding transcription factor [Streptomyces apricus]KAA0912391.1 TetR/AcrR family transcriptional regulator [Streptomyces apricus]
MPKQERAVRTRHSLICAAAEAFERYGYVQAKLSDISASAGVSPGALHFHFKSKAAMAATVEASAGAALRREAQLAQRPGVNALQRLTDTSHALAGRLRGDVVARAGYKLSNEAPRGAGPTLHQEWQGCVRRLLAQAFEEALLIEGTEHAVVGDGIVAATTGFELLGREDAAWLSAATLTAFWRLLLPSIARPETLRALHPGDRAVRAGRERSPIG